MSIGENILGVFVLISIIPIVGAIILYFRGNRSVGTKWNATLPVISIVGTLVAIFSQPLGRENINAPALSLLAIPTIEILLCVAALRFQKIYHIVFWLVWMTNLAIIGIAAYLAFFFRIQF